MGEVLVTYRIMPESPEVDLDQLKADVEAGLPDCASLSGSDIKPFAFGLKALIANIKIADEEGNNDLVEEALGKVPNVQGAELLEMGRLM